METLICKEQLTSKNEIEFKSIFEKYSWNDIKENIYSKNTSDVEHALFKQNSRTLNDFMALVSPAAEPYIEEMAQLSYQLTQKRFGKIIQMYIPFYLSNECQNICTYCGFSLTNNVKRKTLNEHEIFEEIKVIKAYGYDHVLIVTGESPKQVGIDYLKNALRIIKPHFAHVSLEVQPLLQEEYESLIVLGLNTVLVYQETYNKEIYKFYHPKGKKSNFYNRLQTPDRLGKAGIYKIGLGCLIGLDDWRTDSWFTALHLNYLEKNFWETKYSISFPRLRSAVGYPSPRVVMTDKELVQLICAYRIFNEDIELSLSTREKKEFRNAAIKLGITSISAGSKTEPGGYSGRVSALEQFDVCDERSPAEIAQMVKSNGYETVWKDWF